jgi:intracellular multiplication protein IcmP
MWNGTAVNYDQSVQDIKNIPQSSLSNEILGLISYMAMQPLKWPVTVALAAMSIWALFKGPGTQFRRTLDINGLIEVQSNNFQGIRPFKNFNPSNIPPRPPGAPVPAELPPFAEALGPEEWLAYNEIPIPDGNLDEKVTLRALADQLGPRWRGVKYLPEYKQILMAAFCLRAVRKRNESEDLLGRASACWSEAKGFRASTDKSLLKDARRILADKKISGDTIANCNQHGFENTAMLRGLQTAREEGGVLAPATFIWVRAHDRPLWYAMNNLGRQAYHTEALGTMAHYKSERRTSRPIPRPKLDDALTTVRDYVGSAKLRPIPQLDYSASKKKRGVKKPKK